MGIEKMGESQSIGVTSSGGDVVACRKTLADTSIRPDDVSVDLAAQFFRMRRSSYHSSPTQHAFDDPLAPTSEDRSHMTVSRSRTDSRPSSFEPVALSNIPYRVKEPLRNPVKHSRGTTFADSHGRTKELNGDGRILSKRFSGDSGYSTDIYRHQTSVRILQDTYKHGRQRQEGLGAVGAKKTPKAWQPIPALQAPSNRQKRSLRSMECYSPEPDSSFPNSRPLSRYTDEHKAVNDIDKTKSSSPQKNLGCGTKEPVRRPVSYETPQPKGLRRVKAKTTLRSENAVAQSRTPRPEIHVSSGFYDNPSEDSHIPDWSLQSLPKTPKSTARKNTRSTTSRASQQAPGQPTSPVGQSTDISDPYSRISPLVEEHSGSATESDNDSSIESSVFSIPDSPFQPHQLSADDPFATYIDAVVERVFFHFRVWQIRQRGGGQGGEKETQRTNASTPDSPLRSRKRSHSDHPSQTPLGDDADATPDSKRAKLPATATGRMLACPFWKKDPESHRHCYKKVLSRIKYVKQHLYRFHEEPITCVCCGAEFETESSRDEHLRARRCQVVEGGSVPEGLTRAQRRDVQRRADPSKSEEEQWFVIWDIIFPGHPRPTSAYIDSDLSEPLSSFHEFYTSNGPDIIMEHLEIYEPEMRRVYERVVWSQVLDRIYEQWAKRRGLRRAAVGMMTPPRTEPSSVAAESDGAASFRSISYYGAPLSYGQSSYMAETTLPVSTSNLQFAGQGLEVLGSRDGTDLEPDPRELITDLDYLFAEYAGRDHSGQGSQSRVSYPR
ncbi:uncharacterized protein CTRU02_200730 [Colletotrichum truncatum]|uniref:Uncharacterized protein n=1 Tax=Colletotrichum truncatum TaxID=5467 RepID=A0ACC3ZFH6_COLTU|nr:uncharacterized protein CTRU02_00494 [Colletotrichum truncatum]KAF6801745.1 hypothetical protein CTRU02_00494 [Colletotrichum truncatum]